MSRIIVSIDGETVQSLRASGYILYVFKAVRCSDQASRPLVWFRLDSYGTNVGIEWREEYQAYLSTSPIRAWRRIALSDSSGILLNQTLEVHALGDLRVKAVGLPAEIRILNKSTERFTTGISQRHAEGVSPLCVAPLFGNGLQPIAPLPEVLLMFSTENLPPGTVIGGAASLPESLAHFRFMKSSLGGILIDLKGALDGQRKVRFDIDQGWDADHAAWVRKVSASANLVPLLIQQGPSPFTQPGSPAAPASLARP
jgi:hypothetical protein